MAMDQYGNIVRGSAENKRSSQNNLTGQSCTQAKKHGAGTVAAVVSAVLVCAWAVFRIFGGNMENEAAWQYSEAQDSTVYEESADSAVSQEYILPDSNSRYLSYADLEGLSQYEVMLARNEIYARLGRRFNDNDIRAYFESTSWYNPVYTPDEFTDAFFNEYEQANVDLIVAYEKERGLL